MRELPAGRSIWCRKRRCSAPLWAFFDSDQFHSAAIDLAKLRGTVLCEEEGRSPFLKNFGRPVRPYFFANSGWRVQLGLMRPDRYPAALFLIAIADSAGASEQMFV